MTLKNTMNIVHRVLLIISAALLSLAVSLPATAPRGKRMVFGGGPAGGTFQIVANAIQTFGPIKESANYTVKAQSSAGSLENLRKIDRGRMQFGVVYSGHVYLGRHGRLKNDGRKYENVLVMSHLYGAPAQLVVRKGSDIRSVGDLAGRKVGVGNAGSGAFANCELFFTHMGIWDAIERNAMGYNDAAAAFGNRQLDAFWLFTALPSGAVMLAARTNDIALVDLAAEARKSGFFDEYPYFSMGAIPAGTYRGVDRAVSSFQDSALWVANARVPAEVVYDLLSKVYTEAGLAYLRSQKETFKHMSVRNGIKGVVTPLHPGAERFWEGQGLL